MTELTNKPKARIIVVDDNPDILSFIKTILENEFQVYVYDNGQDVIDKFMDIEPDLVILDAMMPMISGYEISDAIRSNPQFKDLPVFMLSALNSMKDHETGYNHGISLYLTKPIEPEILIKNIEIELMQKNLFKPKKYSNDELEKILKES